MASAAPQRAVKLNGVTAEAVDLTAEQVQELTNSSSGWRKCQVPALLGVPLAMKQLAPTTAATRPTFEQPAVFLLMDPRSGFAPPDVQQNGLGEVLLARTDGKDYTVTELWQLHEYNCHLMNRWGDWLEDGMDSPDVQEELQEALSPQGFADHT
uniref:Uncharacterized protein n=1 Tax=Tetradesmus obliquus TaxID=3088 RepID=A0A383WMD6_TETOB|eukprot:jgi/Sobl393_1/1645/SZX78605.1